LYDECDVSEDWQVEESSEVKDKPRLH
jgi:hypothetical protein